MKYQIIIETPAVKDLEKAFLWIAKDSRTNAVKGYRGLIEAFQTLDTFPERCPLAPENQSFKEEIRQLLYGKQRSKFRILFTMDNKNVHILHIRHCAQEPM